MGTMLVVAAPTVAAAEPPTTVPTITSHQNGDVLSGDVVLTADSAASRVRFELSSHAGFRMEREAVVVDGSAVAPPLSTFGFHGAVTISARDCTGAGLCGEPVTVAATVTNEMATLVSPTSELLVGPGESLEYQVDGPDGADVRVGFTGRYETWLRTAPPPYSGSWEQLFGDGDGTGRLFTQVCNRESTACTPKKVSPFPVHICSGNGWYLELESSATGDLVSGDELQVHVLRGCASTYRWRLSRANGTEVVSWRDLGERDEGEQLDRSLDLQQVTGRVLPSGRYRLQLETTATAAGRIVTTRTSEAFVLDTQPDSLRPVRLSGAHLFTYPDDFHDTTRIWTDARVDGDLRVVALDSAGRQVAELPYFADQGFVWRGRNSAGRLVPAGRYTLRMILVDPGGNRTSAQRTVQVSHKRLVKRTWTRTAPARASMIDNDVDGCGRLRTAEHDAPGTLRYEARCRGFGFVRTEHRLRLPRLGPVLGNSYPIRSGRLSFLGGGTGHGHRAQAEIAVTFPGTKGTTTGDTFGARRGWHDVTTYAMDNVDRRHRITWQVVSSPPAYLIHRFRVTLDYYALVRPRSVPPG